MPMAESTPGEERPGGRRVVFLVCKWSHPTSVLAWAWLRQYFLQREEDTLYIVHTGSSGKDDSWKSGGPLGPDLDTAMESWQQRYKVESLGNLQSNLAAFLEEHAIDVVVLGEDSVPRQGVQMVSVSDWVKTNIKRPFIIIRPSAVRNERLRISAHGSALHHESPASPGKRLSLESAPPRKVAIAYPNFAIGRHLLERAKQLVLLPADEIFIVHCFPTEPKLVKQTKTLLRTFTGGSVIGEWGPSRAASGSEVTEDNSMAFGAREMEGYTVHLNVVLRGDPRTSLTAFCEAEGIELLVISTRTGGRIRKTLGGGSVSGYLIDHAPCPCVVVPYKALGLLQEEEDLMSPRPSSPMTSSAAFELGLEAARGGSVSRSATAPRASGGLDPSAAALAALQCQLEEKDRLIAELREEVRQLRLSAAETRDVQAHDPGLAKTQQTY